MKLVLAVLLVSYFAFADDSFQEWKFENGNSLAIIDSKAYFINKRGEFFNIAETRYIKPVGAIQGLQKFALIQMGNVINLVNENGGVFHFYGLISDPGSTLEYQISEVRGSQGTLLYWIPKSGSVYLFSVAGYQGISHLFSRKIEVLEKTKYELPPIWAIEEYEPYKPNSGMIVFPESPDTPYQLTDMTQMREVRVNTPETSVDSKLLSLKLEKNRRNKAVEFDSQMSSIIRESIKTFEFKTGRKVTISNEAEFTEYLRAYYLEVLTSKDDLSRLIDNELFFPLVQAAAFQPKENHLVLEFKSVFLQLTNSVCRKNLETLIVTVPNK